MKLSVVIVNWNTVELLRSCLASIFLHRPKFDFEIIVVDNASKDDSVAMIRREFSSVRLIASTTNLGFGAGNNLAIRETKGEYVLLLNPDTEVIGDVLTATVQHLENNPSVGVVGVKQRESSGKLQESCGNFPSLNNMFVQNLISLMIKFKMVRIAQTLSRAIKFRWMPVKEIYPYFDFNSISTVDWVMGAFMLIRGDALRQAEGFDPFFVMYAEEIDLCKRIVESGFSVHYYGNAEIFHFGGASTASISMRAEAMRTVAMIRFYQKHSSFISALIYRGLILSSNILGMAKQFFRRGHDRDLKFKISKLRIKAALKPSYSELFDVA